MSVYTRDPAKLAVFFERIDIVVSDLKNRNAIKACITAADAVISALEPNGLISAQDKAGEFGRPAPHPLGGAWASHSW